MITLYFGKNLKFLRKSKGLTQNDIVNLLKLTNQSIIANYESEKHHPPIEMLIKIANYFNVSIDELLLVDMAADVTTIVVEEPAAPYRLTMGVDERVKELEELLAAKNEVIEILKKHIVLLEENLKKI